MRSCCSRPAPARRILATHPLRPLLDGTELSPGVEVSDDAELRARLPQLVRTYHHPVGTCRMGADPADGAVVDARGRLHGAQGLVVADASSMPRIPRANTNLPTMMLAERIAGWLTRATPADRQLAAAAHTQQPGGPS